MANDKKIKGIILQIGGDTSDLGKALKTADEQVKKSVSEIKQIDTALKKAPESAVLWTQKQELLTQALQDSKDKLKALESAQDEMKKKFDSGEIGADAYRNFQREVEYAKADVEKFESQLKTANDKIESFGNTAEGVADDAEKLSDSVEEAGENAEKSGDGFTVMKGALANLAAEGISKVVDGIKEYSKSAMDFEDSIAKLSTIADNSVGIDKLKNDIIELSNATGIAETDLANATYDAISAGQATADAVKFVEKATNLSRAGFADTAETLDLLTTILNAYKLESTDTARVSDVLIQTQNLGKTTVAELASAMGKVIPTANAMNVQLEDLAAGYAVMTANGVATAETTTYINSMLNELGKSGTKSSNILKEKTGKSFQELVASGDTLADILGIINQSAEESGLAFNDMWGSAEAGKAGLILLGDSADDYNNVLKQMQNSAGATDTALSKLETTSYKIGKTQNIIKNNLTDISGEIIKGLSPAAEKGTDFLVKNLPKIENTLKKSLPLVEGVAAGFVAWKSAEKIGSIVTSIKNMATAVKSGDTAMKALNATMDANPYLLVGGAILGIGVAVKEYIDNVEPFKTETQKAIDKIEKETEAIIENKNSYQEKKDEAFKAVEADLAQTNQAEALWHELDTLADSTGKVSDKDKDRANFILNELNSALGTEYTMTGNQIEQYDKLKESIEEVIKQKRANILLTAAEAGYTEAITNKTDVEEQQVENQRVIDETRKKLDGMLSNLRTVSGKQVSVGMIRQANAEGTTLNFQGEYSDAKFGELSDLVKMLDEEQKKYDENEEFLRNYYGDINSYESASTEILKGNYDEAVKILDQKDKAFVKSTDILEKNATEQKRILQKQYDDLDYKLRQTIQRYTDGVAGITQETINAAYDARYAAEKELKAFEENSNKTFETMAKSANDWSNVAIKNATTIFTDTVATTLAAATQITSIFGGRKDNVASALSRQVADRIKTIPFFANGGTLKEGQAIIAEAGPELLQIINGQAKVTPLTNSATNTAVGGNETTINNYYATFNVKSMDKPQDIYKISEELGRLQTTQRRAKGQ